MASRISCPGPVTVSLRRSTMRCMASGIIARSGNWQDLEHAPAAVELQLAAARGEVHLRRLGGARVPDAPADAAAPRAQQTPDGPGLERRLGAVHLHAAEHLEVRIDLPAGQPHVAVYVGAGKGDDAPARGQQLVP